MSIYATLWSLKFPKNGDAYYGCEWIEVTAQAVPPHIDYTGKIWNFLPAPVDKDGSMWRAVVFITENTKKGTKRNGQEYINPLLTITGKEYLSVPFPFLYEAICSGLRGKNDPVVAEYFSPGGQHKVIRKKKESVH